MTEIPVKNDRFIRALLKQPVDRTPVWMMRQAGRYLPEYRATRAKAGNFLKLMKNPELACEVTIQPLDRYPLDAAILFSDILTIPDAMGLELDFVAGEGPIFHKPVQDQASIARLGVPDPEQDLGYVMDAVRTIKAELDGRVPLIGFSGSPWTLACYMIEGKGGGEFKKARAMMYAEPEAVQQLLHTLSDAVAAYLNAQIAAGADAVMIFDTWGGLLSPERYRDFSVAAQQRIIAQLNRERDGVKIPVITFSKGCGHSLEVQAETGTDGLGIDWFTNLGDARQRVGEKVALQGNLDPCILGANPKIIEQEVAKVLADYGHGSGHVFNLGHGIHPEIDPENVAAMMEALHRLSPQYHA